MTNPLTLPTYVGSQDVHSLFRVCALARLSKEPVIFDASLVAFVDPLGMAVLAATLEPMISAGASIAIEWMNVDQAAYLARMNFFNRCQVTGVEVRPFRSYDRSETLVELTKISDQRYVDESANSLSKAICGSLGSQYFDPLQYVFSELLENSLTHAKREGRAGASVWVAAQYYKLRDLVRVAVVDNGCGMLNTLRYHPRLGSSKTHRNAIIAALEPRVSCNRDLDTMSDSVNQGVGLTTAHRIAIRAEGSMTIVSGDGRYDSSKGPNTLRFPASWPGVAIAFSLKREHLRNVRISEMLPDLDVAPLPLRFE